MFGCHVAFATVVGFVELTVAVVVSTAVAAAVAATAVVATVVVALTLAIVGDNICDRPRENQPSSHLVMIVEIPVLKFLIGVTSFCSC